MPILAPEIDMFPADFLGRPDVGHESDRNWWPLYTKSRQEKELMRRLRGLDIAFYTPLIRRNQTSPAGRTRAAHVALFAGYVFMYGTVADRHRALTTNCVSRWLPAPSGAELTQDLRRICKLINSGAALTPEARLERGARVKVRSGPLAGIDGVIIQREGRTRLLVAVDFLQQGASLLIEDHAVERCD